MTILPKGTVKRIHVNRHTIAYNRKHGTKHPHWTIQTSKGPIKCYEWSINGIVQGSRPEDKQLSCGARVYMTTYEEVRFR